MSGENGLGGLESSHDLGLSIPPAISREEKVQDDCQGCRSLAKKKRVQ